MSTEIRTFYSLKEVKEKVDAEIAQYKLLLEDYGQWLGTLLRNPESAKNQEWAKKTAELQKIFKSGGRKEPKKEQKNSGISGEWIQFKDLRLSADELGEAEMLFEATEELKNKVEKLEKARNSLIELERQGLGKELLFAAYIRDGVPERIVFKPKKEAEMPEKFEFITSFSVTKQTE